eukprot:394961_1
MKRQFIFNCCILMIGLIFIPLCNELFFNNHVFRFGTFLLDLKYHRITNIAQDNDITDQERCNVTMLKSIMPEDEYLFYTKIHCNLPFIEHSITENIIYSKVNQNQYVFLSEYNASHHYLPSIIFL